MAVKSLQPLRDPLANRTRHGQRTAVLLAGIAFVLAATHASVVHSQVNLEARRSLRVTTTVQRAQYCITADESVDLLRLELNIKLANVGVKSLILPRGPYPIPCFAVARSAEELEDKRFELNSCSTLFIDRSLPKPSPVDDSPDPRYWVVLAPSQTYESYGEVLFLVSHEPQLSSAPPQAPARFCACHDTVIAWPGTQGLDSIPARARDAGEPRAVSTGQHVLVAEVYAVTPHDYAIAKTATWNEIGVLVDDLPFSSPMLFHVASERVRVDCR